MRHQRWLYLLLITTMLLSGCQAGKPSASSSEMETSPMAKVNPLTVSISSQQLEVTAIDETNECLNCHSDKERLIETAKVEEVVESESSGVG